MPDPASIAAGVAAGDPRAVARALTLVEQGGREAETLARLLAGARHRSHVVGFTGGFGSGKSTLVEAVGGRLLDRGERLAVLAVDPSSPFTGGALLGDRVRMNRVASEGGFVRSMATRGVLGGLSAAAGDAVSVLEAAGFSAILVETVGVGQDEVDVAGEVDTVVVLLPPGSGDDVQVAKAGLLEVADVLAVNKADQPGADGVVAALESMVAMAPPAGWVPPVLRTVARTGEGVDALLDAIAGHRDYLVASGRRAEIRQQRRRRRAEKLAATFALEAIRERAGDAWDDTLAAAGDGRIDPYSAARALVDAAEGKA